MSPDPLVRGAQLKSGAHVDVVGAFRRDMRETDDETVRRARIFVDTRDGAFAEAGDILLPLASGVIADSDVLGDLPALCRGDPIGRLNQEDITMFKSVGTAVEDWAAATLAYETTVNGAD
jgi:ornithine cyclodeaminase